MSEGAAKGSGEKPQPKKEERRKFQAIKGTRDLLPPETALWNLVEQTAHEVFATFGFGEIRLPIFESANLFARAVGDETDIVSKEMYSFEDHDFPELARLRTILSSETFVIGDASSFHRYAVRVSEFLKEVAEGIQSTTISRTPENERASVRIPSLLRECQSYQNELGSDAHSEATKKEFAKRFADALEELHTLLRNVSLGDEVSLRPEATASVCRAYIENGMQSLPQPVKLYYMGPMFRRERPQKGRFRQFYQIGAEVLGGNDSPIVDADVIEMVMAFFAKLGLHGTTLHLNSIGHNSDNCRRRYVEQLRTELEKVKDQLGSDSRRRIQTNPLRILDSKSKDEQHVIKTLPRIADYICPDCKEHYEAVKTYLHQRGVQFIENWRLVRGLDYYMRTTFEITAPGLGSQDAVCGGGRYDGLVELLGGPPAKGIGFAIGEDRLVLSLQSQGIEPKKAADVLIAWQDEASYSQAQSLASLLREVGLSVVLPSKAMRPGEGVGMASRLGIPIGIVIGPSEVSAGVFSIKILSEGTQTAVQQNRAAEIGRLLLFRVLLERHLAKVAANHGIATSGRPISSLLSDLTERGIVAGELVSFMKSALATFNRAAHDESLTEEERTAAISHALFVLYRMSALQWMAV